MGSTKDHCPECGEFKRLGNHWQHFSDHRPEFTQKQEEMITGLVMGDATIGRRKKTPNLTIQSIEEEYLQYLDSEFGTLSTGVRFVKSAEEGAKRNRKSGFSPNAVAENYSDVYELALRTHPGLRRFAGWYSTGEKVWPADINLTPTTLRHWYVGDGTLANSRGTEYIHISMANERDSTDKVNNMFRKSGLPEPSTYNHHSTPADYDRGCTAIFNKDKAESLWEYMGTPLPGFEYKWPDRYF